MKKLVILMFVIFLSCSSNEESNNDNAPDINQDLIIGKWTVDKTVYLLDDQIVEEVAPTLCDLLTKYEFFENNTIDLISYIDIGNNNCEAETVDFVYFNWAKLSGDKYKFTSKKPGEAELTNIVSIIFEQSDIMFWPDYFEGTTVEGTAFDERRSFFMKD